jgi:iron complex outermembrane recepter protein
MKNLPLILALILSGFFTEHTYGQDTSKVTDYDALSLKDLLNTKIVSVSKKAESLFDAPLSASVISKEDIQRAGSSSIMEALRLVPGVIVKEQNNGNYDIHLRGVNIPPNPTFEESSTPTLVMINNRPIYSYLKGGTLWETLPVDLNDVEKIEVIRGPAGALYGPNAVNGVINIITAKTKKEGLYLVANSRQGSLGTFINNASAGWQSNKWSAIVSGNYQHRNRSQTSYFEYNRNSYLENPEYFLGFLNDTIFTKTNYPTPLLAQEKYAGNLALSFRQSENLRFNVNTGSQHSVAQRTSIENISTPFSFSSSDSRYVDVDVYLQGITAQASYHRGLQLSEYYPGAKYNFENIDLNIEYNYTKNNFSLKPGVNYRSAVYDDTKYSDVLNKKGMFNARGLITAKSASLRAEQKLLDNKLRLVGGIMANKFNYPDTTYLSYEFAATYKPSRKHIFRAVFSSAARSATISDTYVDRVLVTYPLGNNRFGQIVVSGNKNLKLQVSDLIEIGYRGNLNNGWHIDVELFSTRSKNFRSFVNRAMYTKIINADTIEVNPSVPTNVPIIIVQRGITASLTYDSKKIKFTPFITVQHSHVKNYSPFLTTPDGGTGVFVNPDPVHNNIYSGMGTEEDLKNTPAVYGGATINFIPANRWNVNLSGYYTSAQVYTHFSNTIYNDGIRGIDNIKAKLLLNTTISYTPSKGVNIFCSARNLLDNKNREFFETDEVPFMLQGGFHYEF